MLADVPPLKLQPIAVAFAGLWLIAEMRWLLHHRNLCKNACEFADNGSGGMTSYPLAQPQVQHRRLLQGHVFAMNAWLEKSS